MFRPFAVLCCFAQVMGAQQNAGEAIRDEPRFEVASIKVVAEDAVTTCGDLPCANLTPRVVDPQRFRAMTALTAPMGLIEWAYGVRNFQVVGGPDWLSHEKFEIQATAGRSSDPDQFKRMMQQLLEDRFRLRVHRETRQVPIYSLVVSRKDSRLTPSKDPAPGPGDIEVRPGRLFGRGATMAMLAMILTDNLERPVINRTGLDGHYDFNVTFEPPPPSSGNVFTPIGAAIFGPIQDLGLRIESQKDAVEVLVIDGVEHPATN